MKSRILASVALAATVFTATAASARPGYTINNFNIFEGPGRDFERLVRVPEDARVDVQTCTASYDWCRVNWRGVTGWMDANGIEMRVGGRMVSLADFGPRTGVPSLASRFNTNDERPSRLAWDYEDFDRDGIPNGMDRDRDGDGVPNDDDRYPSDPRRD